MSEGANDSWLQGEPAAGQAQDSDSGNTSVITCLREKKDNKSYCKDVIVDRKERNYTSTRVSESKNHKTKESLRVEKTSEVIESNL